ncbi:MAG: hypothetical protein NVSMB57_05500 [Actinomycetota bacterium]
MSDLAAAYWAEVAERARLMHGTREERLEYQSRVFPMEEALASRLDENDPTLIDDLVHIAESAPDPDALGMFGAGSVSEVLYNGGDGTVERMVQAAERSHAFHQALQAGFFGWDGLSRDAKKRLSPLVEPPKAE